MAVPLIPIIAGAVGAGAASGGSIADTLIQQNFNRQEAQKNRDFQERLSNTAIQRAKADYEAAGLSPAMMFANGSGASAMSGATANSSRGNLGGEMANTINTLINGMIQQKKLDTLQEMNEDRINAKIDMQDARLSNQREIANLRSSKEWLMHNDKMELERKKIPPWGLRND